MQSKFLASCLWPLHVVVSRSKSNWLYTLYWYLPALYCARLYPADSIEKQNVATYLKTLLEDWVLQNNKIYYCIR